jgi:hypothetical protein
MKLFSCAACQQIIHFENSQCTSCGHALAYLPDRGLLTAIEPIADAPGVFVSVGGDGRARYRKCGNDIDHGACNWAVPESESATQRFCRSCRLNDVIPNLSDSEAKQAWLRLEHAKRRLIYTLLELRLPVESRAESPRGMAFALKKDEPGGERVMIGHDAGLITINIAEADSPFREKVRLGLGESYRTLLGHFRHEIGHYYWDRLLAPEGRLEAFRALFGDERADYAAALKQHYETGGPANWDQQFISVYAASHPWEDWAETWAHYMHLYDLLETAASSGLALKPREAGEPSLPRARVSRSMTFDDFVASWHPLTYVLNNLNRSMGLADGYPFVVSPPVIEKLRFVHETISAIPQPAA